MKGKDKITKKIEIIEQKKKDLKKRLDRKEGDLVFYVGLLHKLVKNLKDLRDEINGFMMEEAKLKRKFFKKFNKPFDNG